jgi:hypothetical protein
MTKDEAMLLLSSIMGNRSDLVTKGPTMLKMAQNHYERGPEYPWFLLSEDTTIRTQIGERRVPLPVADFIEEYEDGALFYDAEDGSPQSELEKEDYDYLMKFYGSNCTGTPQAYSSDGLYFNIFPLPNALSLLRMKYYKKDVDITGLSGSATNKWLTYAPNCLIGWAGQNLASTYRDVVAANRFMQIENEARLVLDRQNESHKHSNRTYQIGGPA